MCLLHRNCDNTGTTKWRWKICVSIHTRVSRNFIKDKYCWDMSTIFFLILYVSMELDANKWIIGERNNWFIKNLSWNQISLLGCKMKHNWKFFVSCSIWLDFIDMFCTFFSVSPFSLSLALWFGGIHQLLLRPLFFDQLWTLTLIYNLILFLAITKTAFSHSGVLWSFGSVGDPCALKC